MSLPLVTAIGLSVVTLAYAGLRVWCLHSGHWWMATRFGMRCLRCFHGLEIPR